MSHSYNQKKKQPGEDIESGEGGVDVERIYKPRKKIEPQSVKKVS